MKNKIRSAFAEQIKNWLSDKEFRELLDRKKYKIMPEIAFDHLVRWYAQVDDNGRDNYSAGGIIERLHHCKISKEASSLCRDLIDDETYLKKSKSDKKTKLKSIVHYEHNVPVKIMKNKLLNLVPPFTVDDVKDVLNKDYEIIIISKAEMKKIDSSIYKASGEYEERLNYAEISLIDIEDKENLIYSINAWLNIKNTN